VICLDTDVVIAAINGRSPLVRRQLELALTSGVTVGLPTIVLYELWTGVRKSARPETHARLLQVFLALGLDSWSFDEEDAAEAGDIRATLERVGTPIGPYDLLIAAQARRRKACVATANTSEFRRVPGLGVEAWNAG
jgi:tRNA(fMet)-specific endonuclease VapC